MKNHTLTVYDDALPAPPISAPLAVRRRVRERLESLPRDVGYSLLAIGTAGMVIPGPVPMGGVLVAVGTFFVWPKLLDRWGEPLARRFPRLHDGLSFPVERFQRDLERRYPGVTRRRGARALAQSRQPAQTEKISAPRPEEQSTMRKLTPHNRLAAQSSPGGDGLPKEVEEFEYKLKHLPPEIGTLLVVVGVAGILLPGPVGSPFLIAGGVALWPSAFERIEHWYAKRFPKTHRSGMRVINRFISDLEKRYPGYARRD